MLNNCDTVIIGGGLSGLFFAESLYKKKYKDYLLINTSENELGGYALWGGMKIGLPPAGQKTSDFLQAGDYSYYTEKFVDEYGIYLKLHNPLLNGPIQLNSCDSLYQKYYISYILEQRDGNTIVANIISNIHDKIIYDTVVDINVIGKHFVITAFSGSKIVCSRLVIATGRNNKVLDILSKLGEDICNVQDMLVGCRITFDSKEAVELANSQLDLRIKNSNHCQTYCFNCSGKIHRYTNSGYNIYTGSLEIDNPIGNCFIGKRVKTTLAEAVSSARIDSPLRYSHVKYELATRWNPLLNDIYSFSKELNSNLGLKFIKLHFPALEQFWPRPSLSKGSLESTKITNLYYVGDASGISFGVIQCYITSNYLSDKLFKG